jgi:mitochondrial import inner membrane translocase subunit TIM21
MSLKAQAFQQACRGRYLLSNTPPAFPPSTARLLQRSYAAQSNLGGSSSPGASQHPQRKAITVTSDDGRLHWSELSTREKAARSTQQSINFVIVAAGAAGTVMPLESSKAFTEACPSRS